MPASSDPPPDPTASPAGAGPDLGRRVFFRKVAGDLVQTAASLTGAAAVASSAVAGAAAAAQELGATTATPPPTSAPPATRPSGPSLEQLARAHLAAGVTPWSWDGDRLLVLDLRRLPAVQVVFPVTAAGDAARAIGERVAIGPSAAIVAVWGLALGSEATAHHEAGLRATLLRGSEQSLLAAAPGSHVLRTVVAAMVAAITAGEAPRVAAARQEAGIRADHAQLADRLASVATDLGVTQPLVHGSGGALWGAGVGVTLDAAVRLRGSDAWPVAIAEGRPWLDGARVTAWELEQLGVPARVLLDAAAPGAVMRGEVDGVVCAAERVAADGSVSLPPGGLGLALAAAHMGVPFLVAAAPWAVDAFAADAASLGEPALSATVVARTWGSSALARGATLDAAPNEVVPSDLVSRLVTLG